MQPRGRVPSYGFLPCGYYKLFILDLLITESPFLWHENGFGRRNACGMLILPFSQRLFTLSPISIFISTAV